MPVWLSEVLAKSTAFIPHGHCYLWIPGLLWLHVVSDILIGLAYVGISLLLYLLVRKIRLPFSPVFIAFGLFIGLCGLTHFMAVWTVWNPDYWFAGLIKAGTAAASVATAVGLFFVRPQVEEVVHTARLSEERRIQLETKNAELEALYSKIKELDELKTQFFANVSHELRTPLALILGPAERLLADRSLSTDQRRQAESIQRNGKSLLKQVNDLLDVATLEEGKKRVHYSRLDLADWFGQLAAQFELAAEHRGIDLQVCGPATLPVEVDANMLERVLSNLLSNALKFTPAGGQVSLHLQGEGETFIFSVKDTGPGIRPEQQEAIFERFRQVDGGANREHGGTGLGLAIARDFVELLGGRIELNSTPGEGAHFLVRLPSKAPATVEDVPPVQLHAAAETRDLLSGSTADFNPPQYRHLEQSWPQLEGRPSILLVEDTREMSDFIASTLAEEYNVVTAFDGQEGLERACELQPDLVITDVMMPRMSGDQLVPALRSRSELKAVPILLLSAKSDDALRIRLLQAGAQDYLTKPFVPQELLARTRNLLAMKRVGDSLRQELTSASVDVVALARELTLRHRQLQTALDATEVAREQAERANQVKSHFLALASHEMRTPLSTIVMNAELLERLRREPDDAARAPLERLQRAGQKLTILIEGLLEYTRLQSSKINADLQIVDTVSLCQEVIEASLLETDPGKVSLELAPVPPDLTPFETDPRLLRVILSNLISNALKFTRQGRVSLRLSNTVNWHVFEVQDTGIGIPEQDIPRIFLPFEQLEPIQRKSIPGVGLGLALVKEIVEALQGRVEVISRTGEGSTFRVLLPDHPEQTNNRSFEREGNPGNAR